MSYFCPTCGWHPCRCPDWRALERARVAAGGYVARLWTCDHSRRANIMPNRSHTVLDWLRNAQ